MMETSTDNFVKKLPRFPFWQLNRRSPGSAVNNACLFLRASAWSIEYPVFGGVERTSTVHHRIGDRKCRL
jgi:hypothetical protein